MFRHERPQKGRLRQFHQLDVEILGVAEPQADIEVLALGHDLLCALGIGDQVTLEINTLGDQASRSAYRDALRAYLDARGQQLRSVKLAAATMLTDLNETLQGLDLHTYSQTSLEKAIRALVKEA